jgi:hypothetical protein
VVASHPSGLPDAHPPPAAASTQVRLLCGLPLVGTPLTLVLSALLHAYDSFEFVWEHQGYGVAQRFALIEQVRVRARVCAVLSRLAASRRCAATQGWRLPRREVAQHWLYFLGYGGVLASVSIHLRFWDLFALRAVLYPLYIANAPHARFEPRRVVRPLPVFQMPLVLFNSFLSSFLAALRFGGRAVWERQNPWHVLA